MIRLPKLSLKRMQTCRWIALERRDADLGDPPIASFYVEDRRDSNEGFSFLVRFFDLRLAGRINWTRV